ncbi:MAG: NAD(P)/FAD-dependent oxidoreductase [Anaerolineae bacterium]|nr:NAD(P)/FAD-dependent oxidoreductase [Anaerolineae bacterium]
MNPSDIKEKYDVIIVGAGPSGIFTAYEAKKNNPALQVLLVEKGHSIEKRKCPKRKTGVCANCSPCNITTGFSGGGSFSDGKLSISEDGEIGGDLAHYIGLDRFRKVLHYTDDLYVHFGADTVVFGNESNALVDEIHRSAIQAHMKLIDSGVRHMGTEKAYEIYSRIQNELQSMGVDMLFDSPVKDFIIEEDEDGEKKAAGVVLFNERQISAGRVVAGVGREGSEWLNGICHVYGINSKVGPVDIGCRIETDAAITAHIDNTLYEAKLIYYTPTFEDRVRTFCWNPRGEVAEEKYGESLAVVNGHSYKDEALKSTNTNFALLVSKNFTQPFKTPIEYGRYIAEMGNMLSGNKVLVQRYGDLKRGRRTTLERLSKNIVRPTLKDAVPGDLSLVLPYRIMLDIIETIEGLERIMPGLAGDSTLIYGVEVKFYSNRIVVDKQFQTNIRNLHVLGDGAGLTRGLMQASMNGICMGRILTGKW